jgi:predicted DNA-binding protein
MDKEIIKKYIETVGIDFILTTNALRVLERLAGQWADKNIDALKAQKQRLDDGIQKMQDEKAVVVQKIAELKA